MCFNLHATHACNHLHLSFARCFWARNHNLPACRMLIFPTWYYYENFSCPECRDWMREECVRIVRRWQAV